MPRLPKTIQYSPKVGADKLPDIDLNDLQDVDTSGAISGDVIEYDGTGWIAATPSGGGVTDHGALTGLTDDDHTQYLLADSTRHAATGLTVEGTTNIDFTYHNTGTASDEMLLRYTPASDTWAARNQGASPIWQFEKSSFGTTTYFKVDAAGQTLITHSGSPAITTDTGGANVFSSGGAGTSGEFDIYDGDSNYLAIRKLGSDGSALIYNIEPAGVLQLAATKTGSTQAMILEGDPDGATTVYYNGSTALQTRASGHVEILGDSASDTPSLWFVDSASNDLASLWYDVGTNQMIWQGWEAGAVFSITSRNAGDTAYNLMIGGDPDGDVSLGYAGNVALRTIDGAAGRGFRLLGESTNNRALIEYFNNAETARTAYIWADPSTGLFQLNSEMHGAPVRLRGEDAGGTGRILANFDPDGASTLYHAGTATLDTISGSIKFGTHTTIGAETVTGYITIQDSGGTSRKLAVVS